MNECKRIWNFRRFPPSKTCELGSKKQTRPGASAAAAWPFSGVSVGSCSQETWSMLQNLLDCHQYLYGQWIVIQALKRYKYFISVYFTNTQLGLQVSRHTHSLCIKVFRLWTGPKAAKAPKAPVKSRRAAFCQPPVAGKARSGALCWSLYIPTHRPIYDLLNVKPGKS